MIDSSFCSLLYLFIYLFFKQASESPQIRCNFTIMLTYICMHLYAKFNKNIPRVMSILITVVFRETFTNCFGLFLWDVYFEINISVIPGEHPNPLERV